MWGFKMSESDKKHACINIEFETCAWQVAHVNQMFMGKRFLWVRTMENYKP